MAIIRHAHSEVNEKTDETIAEGAQEAPIAIDEAEEEEVVDNVALSVCSTVGPFASPLVVVLLVAT